VGGSYHQGRRPRETLVSTLGDIPNGSGQASCRRQSWTHVPIIQYDSNNENSSAGDEDKDNRSDNNARWRSMPDFADINIVELKNLDTKDASIVSSFTGSSGIYRSGTRKQDAYGEISFNSGSNNKRQRKNDLPSDVDMSCKQIFDDNVASVERINSSSQVQQSRC
jgi:hypothetical protein